MDEVDGMSSGDQGGIAELIQLIKKTRVPIICVCNDRSHPKVRSLAGHCLDLHIKRYPSTFLCIDRMRDKLCRGLQGLQSKRDCTLHRMPSRSSSRQHARTFAKS